MARIAIDATPISVTGKGLSRFLSSFLTAIASCSQQHEFVVFLNARNTLPHLPSASHIQYVKIRMPNSLIWDLFQFPIQLERRSIDLLFSCSDRLPILYTGPIVLYLFELPGPRHRINWSRASRYAKLSMKVTEAIFPVSVRRAKRIVASSQATKSALCSSFDVPAAQVDVIYPGRDEGFTPEISLERRMQIAQQLNAPQGYILHFSSVIDPRDNSEVALRTFHSSRNRIPDKIKLVVAGKTNPDAQGLTTILHELALEEVVSWVGFIPEADLADTYRSALLYFDPSLYEGFGYQVLEALSCGSPVVCSNVTSLPEIVGDAAITAHPQDVQAFSDAIAQTLQSPEQQAAMRAKGLQQVQKFAWSRAVIEILEVFERVLCE